MNFYIVISKETVVINSSAIFGNIFVFSGNICLFVCCVLADGLKTKCNKIGNLS